VIVTVANRKGGVGKTTSSVFLAHALAGAVSGRCVVIDADPQNSSARWARRAADAGQPLAIPVLAQPTPRLTGMISVAPNVVIDTPPGEGDVVEAAIGVADLVVVPVSSSSLDLSVVRATLDAAARNGKPAAVLLTRTRRTRSVASAEEELRSAGARVLLTRIPLREALAMAFGRPVRDLHGYDLAMAELMDALPPQPYSLDAVRERVAIARAERPAEVRVQFGPTAIDQELMQRLRSSLARLAAPR
jgi:chromosome partitioning protein